MTRVSCRNSPQPRCILTRALRSCPGPISGRTQGGACGSVQGDAAPRAPSAWPHYTLMPPGEPDHVQFHLHTMLLNRTVPLFLATSKPNS